MNNTKFRPCTIGYGKGMLSIWVRVQMGGPIWVSQKPIFPCGCHCNAHVVL